MSEKRISSYGHGFEPRFKLEEAKFFYQQMELALRNIKGESSPTKFLFYLDAFLAAARNVTFVFQKEFNKNKKTMGWYEKKVQEWQEDKVMRLFIEMRNLSTKEHTPETLTFSASKGGLDIAKAIIAHTANGDIQIKIPVYGSTEITSENKDQLRSSAVYFYRVPQWFDENPDVILLCKHYIEKLEGFVVEAEKMIEKKEKQR